MKSKSEAMPATGCPSPIENDNGSVIVVVIILLALLTVVGISATNMSITESYITRNASIANQDVDLADMAAMEGIRWLLDQNSPSLLDPNRLSNDWLNPVTMNENPNSLVLTDNNSMVPAAQVTVNINGVPTLTDTPTATILAQRKETATTPLRYYFMGWTSPPGNSLKVTGPRWKTGKVVGVYDSPNYGHVSVEIGIKKKF